MNTATTTGTDWRAREANPSWLTRPSTRNYLIALSLLAAIAALVLAGLQVPGLLLALPAAIVLAHADRQRLVETGLHRALQAHHYGPAVTRTEPAR